MRRFVAVAAATVCLVASGCSEDDEPAAPPKRKAAAERPPPEHSPPKRKRLAKLRQATCPSGVANCRAASGRILYVERVDPDGDGDAHFVLLSRSGVTSPGISVIDVRQALRPSPLPGPGDRLSAAGPVETGSYGQSQIAAVELHVAMGG